jgi:hypothetical protein
LALLEGGFGGLILSSTMTEPDVPSPTALVFSALMGNQVQFFAATAGREDAIPLAFDLTAVNLPEPTPAPEVTVAQLVPLRSSSLSLAGTLLVTSLQTFTAESVFQAGGSEANAAIVMLIGPATLVGQRVPGPDIVAPDDTGSDAVAEADYSPAQTEAKQAESASRTDAIWKRYLLGTDEAEEPQNSKDSANPPSTAPNGPSALVVPPHTIKPLPETGSRLKPREAADAVDMVLDSLTEAATSPDRATTAMLCVLAHPAPEAARSVGVTPVAPVAPDPAHAYDVPSSRAPEFMHDKRIAVPISMVVASVVAFRVFPSRQRRTQGAWTAFVK